MDARRSANPSTSAAPANSARAAPSIPICWSPPLGRDSKTTGGKGGKGGNLESSGNGPLSDDGAKRRKPGGNWRKPPAGTLLEEPSAVLPSHPRGPLQSPDWRIACGNCGNSLQKPFEKPTALCVSLSGALQDLPAVHQRQSG